MVTTPTVGFFGVNIGPGAAPDGARQLAVLAEELGYDSIWAPEHVVLPDPRVKPSPMAPEEPIMDPLITLAAVAGVTSTVKLATGIVILPQRNPLVLSKELTSLDVLSSGRLLFGVGVGYLEPEMSAIGVPMRGRGARTDEYLDAMHSLWRDDKPRFSGEYVSFAGVDARPRPVNGTVPIVIGGHSAGAHRRAARYHGWYGFALDRASTAEQIESLRTHLEGAGRELSDLEISVSPGERLDRQVVADYAGLGVDRLVVVPPRKLWRPEAALAEMTDFVRANTPAELGLVA
jgi:probable F420-dependent oxidoreductase